MEYAEVKRFLPSRRDGIASMKNKTEIRSAEKSRVWRYGGILSYALGICLGAMGYYLLGISVQYADPTAAWLDLGTLSLPLFAAWSCMLGIGIAGLLPAVYPRISKKGGIQKWKKEREQLSFLVVYIGYIVLLCCLL